MPQGPEYHAEMGVRKLRQMGGAGQLLEVSQAAAHHHGPDLPSLAIEHRKGRGLYRSGGPLQPHDQIDLHHFALIDSLRQRHLLWLWQTLALAVKDAERLGAIVHAVLHFELAEQRLGRKIGKYHLPARIAGNHGLSHQRRHGHQLFQLAGTFLHGQPFSVGALRAIPSSGKPATNLPNYEMQKSTPPARNYSRTLL